MTGLSETEMAAKNSIFTCSLTRIKAFQSSKKVSNLFTKVCMFYEFYKT